MPLIPLESVIDAVTRAACRERLWTTSKVTLTCGKLGDVGEPMLPMVFTVAMARARGYSPYRIEQNVRTGRWHALRRGIFCLREHWAADAGDPMLRHVMEATAARLSVARFTVVSGWSAAVLHNLPCPAARLGLVTLTAECGARIRRPDLHVAVAPLPTAHVQDRFGVPTTTAARCAVDVARQSGADDFASVVCLLDAALHDGKASRVELQRMLDGMRRWPGSGVAVRALAFADEKAETPLESRSRVFIAEAGLPAPATQVEICDDTGRFVARVDFLWPEYRTVGEADGRTKYRQPGDLYKEKRREDRLRELGLEIVRWSWADIHDRSDETEQRIWQAFARGRARSHADAGFLLLRRS